LQDCEPGCKVKQVLCLLSLILTSLLEAPGKLRIEAMAVSSRILILVIEDDPRDLDLICYLLRAAGYEPETALTGEHGLEMAAKATPDLVLCDLRLPGIDGYEVAHQLRREPRMRSKPLVAVSCTLRVGDEDRVRSKGFDGQIPKPLAAEEFARQVEAFLPAELRLGRRPATPAPAAETPAQPTVEPAIILLVDDDPTGLQVTRNTLEPVGYRVLEAGSVAEALELARRRLPDLILSDLHMPDQTGADLVRLVRADKQLQSIPVLVLSATAWQIKEHEEELGLGPEGFILRPIEPQELLARVEGALHRSRASHGQDPDSG
jgi:two-component system cell cycle response regulator DivK